MEEDKFKDKAKETMEAAEHVADVAVNAVGDAAIKTADMAMHPQKIVYAAQEFFRLEAAGGIMLVLAAAIAIIIANTTMYGTYHYFLNAVDFRIGFSDLFGRDLELKKSLLLWINDGMMAVFFFLVGLEIKRDFTHGALSSWSRALLPVIAAIGGMAFPILIYWFINKDHGAGIDGWAIPAATDIAFAIGVLALVGSRVPNSLKSLLLGIAVIDDIGAILIIAIFFSHEILMPAVYVALGMIGILAFMNVKGVTRVAPYVLCAIILWVAVLESGIHATIAGVIAAMFVPMKSKEGHKGSPGSRLEHSLHPWVAYAVLPIFGFANAGVPFKGMTLESVLEPVTLGIAAGLFFGKQVGVFLTLWLAIILGISPKPKGANWVQLYAVALLCGIGFTMSLFIGGLAFHGIHMQASVRLGVLVGSIASAVLAFLLLKFGPSGQKT